MRTGRITVTTSVYTLTLPIRSPSQSGDALTEGVQFTTSADNDAPIYVSQNPDITADADDETDGYPIPADTPSFFLPASTFGPTNILYLRAPSGSQVAWWMLV
jgi:hypothetical protein